MNLGPLLIALSALGCLLALTNIICANLYDVQRIKQQRLIKKRPHARRYRQRPSISVIVYAQNDAPVIIGSLKALFNSNYRKLNIVVIDNASTDGTGALAKQFIKQNPKKRIVLRSKRRKTESLEAIAGIRRKDLSSKLVMVINAGDMVENETLASAVRHFNVEQNLAGLRLDYRVRSSFSTVGAFQKLDYLLRSRSQKFNSLTNSDYRLNIVGSIFRSASFFGLMESVKSRDTLNIADSGIVRPDNRTMAYRYASEAVVYQAALPSLDELLAQRFRLQLGLVQAMRPQYRLVFATKDHSYTKVYRWLRVPLAVCSGLAALLAPFLLTYLIYLSVSLHEPAILLVLFALVAVFLLIAVWTDDKLGFKDKLSYTGLLPAAYGLFYLLSFIQPVALMASFRRKSAT